MSRARLRPRVVIVGAGLAGTATAIRLLCFARRPLEIILLERRPNYRSAGVAYHRDGNPWGHVFNIQAGRMSVFREDVLDFIRWANDEADRRHWPAPWDDFEFVEHGPAPRRIFQNYLMDRLATAARQACPGVVLVEADGEATDVKPGPSGAEVTVRQWSAPPGSGLPAWRGSESAVILADHVVLATGLELREPPFAAEALGHPAFVRNPFSAAGVSKLTALAPQATVAIIGSTLSAYDSAGLLLRQRHLGPIYLISKTGTIFRTYPRGHEHGVVRLPCPKSLLEPYQGREDFLARVRAEWKTACATLRGEHPDIDPAVVAERVTKAWEPHLPEAIAQIPSAELQGLLDEFSTTLASVRVGAVEHTMAIIEQAMHPGDGRVRLVAGKVEKITPADSGRLTLRVATPEGECALEADLVVSNFSREWDYRRAGQPLWRNLLQRGTAVPHERTGRGLEVDEHGTLLDLQGRPVRQISAVGPLREGDEMVRNGRVGAFTFNLAAIKNQSIVVAARAIEEVESQEDWTKFHDQFQGCVSNMKEAARAQFEEAVNLEVRRLVAKSRKERELLDSRLAVRIRTMDEPPTFSPGVFRHDELTRGLIHWTAVERLTDVTVTPRQLRRQLGIANTDDLEG
ncbi:FAD/NAD(P)-binding protein [Streptomyces griseorubiginosus]|uniref:FAD/NAD(P)-binding protein n=1 Tax=Streptomyces griseorubiginosus TaxID=67304 RepID=UPI0033D3D3B9